VTGRQDFDVTIAGNGAIGNALAIRLSHDYPDMRIALVGSKLRPGCASLAAGAMLNVFAELEEGSLAYPTARKKFDLAVQASALWPAQLELLNARLSEVPPVELKLGTHVVSNAVSDEFDDLNFQAIIGYLREYGERFREIDPHEIRGIKPIARSRPLRAILIDNEGTVSSKHLHRAYDEAFSRTRNISVFDTEVDSIDASGTWKIAGTKAGDRIASRQIVLAAGVSTQTLIEQLGLESKIPRVVMGVGAALILKSTTAVPEKVFRTPNRGLACGIYVVPYDGNYCYVGATNYISPCAVPLPRVQAVQGLLTAAMEQVNSDLYKAEIHKTIVGYRPTTMDTFPLFGETSIEGIWIATGTKRDGFHLSPRIAEEFAKCLNDRRQPFGGTFVPERKLILEVPRHAAIDRAVTHVISTAYQHGFTLPHANWEPLIEDAVRQKVLDAYERSGMSSYPFGIPPELLDMYRYGHAGQNVAALMADEAVPVAAASA
jgi:glycine/D-amino acid oxidase-like deaminating enzyme